MSIQDPDKPGGRTDLVPGIVPPRLQSGDTIAVAAPSGLFDRRALDAGVRQLKSAGLQVMVPDEVFLTAGRYAGSDRQRAELLMRLITDPKVKAVLCIRGGYGAMRILPLLDYRALRRHPKIIVGFSDITALLIAIHQNCQLVTYHGPLVTSLAESDARSRDAFFQALFQSEPMSLQARPGGEINSGRATAPVLGGNLTTLNHLLATAHQPRCNGRILLLEDRAEQPYRLDRMLTQMKQAGCLDDLAGVGLGSFESCGEEQELFEIVADILAGKNIPILARLPFGHGVCNMTLPIGQMATIDTARRTLTFEAAALRPAQ